MKLRGSTTLLVPEIAGVGKALLWMQVVLWLSASGNLPAQTNGLPELAKIGVTYTNYQVSQVPWSIHIVEVSRSNPRLVPYALHAGAGALGMAALSSQLPLVPVAQGEPVAAINGDFYLMERAFAGHPRGLQIIEGEPISTPSGGVVFWLDVFGRPQMTNVISRFHVTWPDGSTTPFDLNGERAQDNLELYTARLGASTHTLRGRELVLEKVDSAWLPLRMGKTYSARVREVREGNNAPLIPDTLVLSIGAALKSISAPAVGSVIHFSTESTPNLGGARTAIGGGSSLVHEGRKQKIQGREEGSYEATTMLERHPRTAFGWNAKSYFLVVVDGRQKKLSAGMTLDELATEMMRLGCEEAMSFDGGGSTTLWCGGSVRNSPCDGRERPIANSLVILQKPESSKIGMVTK